MSDPFGTPVAAEDETFSFELGEDKSGGSSKQDYSVPRGDYSALVESVAPFTASTGRKMLLFKFVGTEGLANGKTFPLYSVEFKTLEILNAVGVKIEGKSIAFKKADVIGKPVTLTLVPEEYNGKINSKISKVMPPKAAGPL